ncbi:hypothetical protein CDAR_270641 [Caerostris darwini]|uniref:Uncharacterized protein n=1 Tax=Caerostris darwini TaxID=1538125 RepID=A0AAV4TFG3_9ARAC|nr:hypothetical protein CDAR_270641 [Caerostris darwini]
MIKFIANDIYRGTTFSIVCCVDGSNEMSVLFGDHSKDLQRSDLFSSTKIIFFQENLKNRESEILKSVCKGSKHGIRDVTKC